MRARHRACTVLGSSQTGIGRRGVEESSDVWASSPYRGLDYGVHPRNGLRRDGNRARLGGHDPVGFPGTQERGFGEVYGRPRGESVLGGTDAAVAVWESAASESDLELLLSQHWF